MPMQYAPLGWTAGDVARFNAMIDACQAYMVFDYARKIVAPANAFLQARQTDLGNNVLTLGQTFINDWNQP